jgi:hypothetical protein
MRPATTIAVCASVLSLAACGFVTNAPDLLSSPGFFHGVWHGLLAPWTLILRLFMDIKMYGTPNSGWFYDLGFLLGVGASIPLGWIAATIALLVHLL